MTVTAEERAIARPSAVPAAALLVAAHELPIVAAMLWVAAAGHSTLACVAATLLFAGLAIAYAPLARTRPWARDHIVDLAAMAAVMVVPLWSGAHAISQPGAVHEHGLVSLGPAAFAIQLGVVAAWAVVRIALARRPGDRSALSLASGIVCAAGLAWMLIV